MPLTVDCLGDLHGFYPKTPGGDLLVIAGDLVARGRLAEYKKFFEWLEIQKYEKKVVIAGNHDKELQRLDKNKLGIIFDTSAEYLCDSGTEYKDLKIWGSPWTPKFGDWGFMCRDEDLIEHWDMIPNDTNFLVTHGPPYGILDKCYDDRLVGSKTLLKAIDRVRPLVHVFGHIHESEGVLRKFWSIADQYGSTTFLNCSHVDEHYIPKPSFTRLQIPDGVREDQHPIQKTRLLFRQ